MACEMPGTGGGSSGTCDPMPIIQASCDGSFCHGTVSAAPLDPMLVNFVFGMTADTLAQALLNTPASYPYLVPPAHNCPTGTPELLIDGGDAGASLLLRKLTGTAPTNFACGEPMPDTAGLPAADLQCLTTWVNSVVQP